MKKALLVLGLALAFLAGYAVNSLFTKQDPTPMKRVTGIGGIFFKCKDPKQMRAWYKTHLGIESEEWGAIFPWREQEDSTKEGYTVWSPFNEKSDYFAPSSKDFMINYRVANLDALVIELKKEGVTFVDEVIDSEFGKFVHILDIENNKIELWEPK